jgi:hypothetical protein
MWILLLDSDTVYNLACCRRFRRPYCIHHRGLSGKQAKSQRPHGASNTKIVCRPTSILNRREGMKLFNTELHCRVKLGRFSSGPRILEG